MIIFAALDADSIPYEVPAGVPFTTHRLRVADEQEAAWTLVPVGSFAPVEVNHSAVALDAYGSADLDRYGIQRIDLAVPAGQLVASYELALHADGTIYVDAIFADVPPPPPILVVSARQLRRALRIMDLRDAVEAAVAGSGDPDLQDYWQFTSEFHRDHPKVALMVAAVGKTSAEADALWALAGAQT